MAAQRQAAPGDAPGALHLARHAFDQQFVRTARRPVALQRLRQRGNAGIAETQCFAPVGVAQPQQQPGVEQLDLDHVLARPPGRTPHLPQTTHMHNRPGHGRKRSARHSHRIGRKRSASHSHRRNAVFSFGALAVRLPARQDTGHEHPHLETTAPHRAHRHRPGHQRWRRRQADPCADAGPATQARSLPDARRFRHRPAGRLHRRLPRPPAPRLRDRHLHARRAHAPSRFGRQRRAARRRRCAMDDRRARCHPQRDAGTGQRPHGRLPAVAEPRGEGQASRPVVPRHRRQTRFRC